MFLSANIVGTNSVFFPPSSLFPQLTSPNNGSASTVPSPSAVSNNFHLILNNAAANQAPSSEALGLSSNTATIANNPFLQLPYAAKSHYWLAAAAAAAAASSSGRAELHQPSPHHGSPILSALANKERHNQISAAESDGENVISSSSSSLPLRGNDCVRNKRENSNESTNLLGYDVRREQPMFPERMDQQSPLRPSSTGKEDLDVVGINGEPLCAKFKQIKLLLEKDFLLLFLLLIAISHLLPNRKTSRKI
jgi:hypothetical protein